MSGSKLRRWTSCLLCTLLLLSSIPLAAFASSAENTVTFTVGNVTATAGETVEVPISISNNIEDGISSVGFASVDYNDTVFTLTDQKGIADYTEASTWNGAVYIDPYDYTTFVGDGVIAILCFEVASDAAAGPYVIGLTVDWVDDSEYERVNSTVNPGTITVSSGGGGGTTPSASGGGFPATNERPYTVTWNYGGSVAENLAITTNDGYRIDEIWVDGQLYQDEYDSYHGMAEYAYSGSNPQYSINVHFAYIVNFPDPDNGTLSVIRNGKTLKSGDIVRGGDILTIEITPDDGYGLKSLDVAGMTAPELVTARNADAYAASAAAVYNLWDEETPPMDYDILPDTGMTQVLFDVTRAAEPRAGETLTYTCTVNAKNGEDTPSISVSFDIVDVTATVSTFEQLKAAVAGGKTEITLTGDVTVKENWIASAGKTVTIQGDGRTLTIPNSTSVTIGANTHVVLKDITLESKVNGTAVKLAEKATLDLYNVTANGGGVTMTFFENKADGSVMNIYSLTALAENMAEGGLTLDLTSETIFWPRGTINVESFQVGEGTGVCVIKPTLEQSGYRILSSSLSTGTSSEDLAYERSDYTVAKTEYPYTLKMDVVSTEGECATLQVESKNVQFEEGGQFTVNVDFDNQIAGGVIGGDITFSYDTNVFKLVGAAMGEDFTGCVEPTLYTEMDGEQFRVGWKSEYNLGYHTYTTGGKFLTLTFEFASAAVANGDYEITVSSARWLNQSKPNNNFSPASREYLPGTITVYGGMETDNDTGHYTLQPAAANGSITLSKAEADKGEKFTVTATPNEGYLLSSVNVVYNTSNAAGTGYVMEMQNITVDREFTIPDNVVSNNINVVATFMTPEDLHIWFSDAGGKILLPSTDGKIHVAPGAKIYAWRNYGVSSDATVRYQVSSGSSGFEEKTLTISAAQQSTSTADYLYAVDQATTVYVSSVTGCRYPMLAEFVPDEDAEVGHDWNITFQYDGLPDGVEPIEAPYATVVMGSTPSASSLYGAVFGTGSYVTLEYGTQPYGYSITNVEVVTDAGETVAFRYEMASSATFYMPASNVTAKIAYAPNTEYPVTITQPEAGMGTVYVRTSTSAGAYEHLFEDEYWSEWMTDGVLASQSQVLQVKVDSEDYTVKSVTYNWPETRKVDVYGNVTIGITETQNVAPYQVSMQEGPLEISVELQKKGEDRAISNRQELEQFRADVAANPDAFRGVTVALTDDIDLTGKEWVPIGTEEAPFYGTFDGQGHTISGLTIHDSYEDNTGASSSEWEQTSGNRYLGLFGHISNSTIQNLTVRGEITSTVTDPWGRITVYAGGIAGYASYGCTMTGCTSDVKITLKGNSIHAGGILGSAYSHWRGNTFTRCLNYGELSLEATSSSSYVGGQVIEEGGSFGGGGITSSTDRVTMVECGNYGAISGFCKQNNGRYAPSGSLGGLMSSVAELGSIERSFNQGNISGRMVYGGGLVGYSNTTDGDLTVTDSYNTGSVTNLGNIDINKGSIQYLVAAGLVGSSMRGSSGLAYPVTLTNCYSTATDTSKQAIDFWWDDLVDSIDPTITNCYGPETATDQALADKLGSSFVYNATTGRPELKWENDSTATGSYKVTFQTTPANAQVALFYDAAHTNPVEGWVNGGVLTAGTTYFYEVSAENYFKETGSFRLPAWDYEVQVNLNPMVTVTFNVNPYDADTRVHHVDLDTLEPVASKKTLDTADIIDGVVYETQYTEFTFNLIPGERYEYAVSREGYTSDVDVITAPEIGEVRYTIKLEPIGGQEIDGGYHITKAGTYNIKSGARGTIYVDTSEPVILVGTGVSDADCYYDLTIKCTVSRADLTIKNLFINNGSRLDTSTVVEPGTYLIDFTGSGNRLNFQGTNLLEQQSYVSSSGIHVGSGTSLVIGDASDSGKLYLFKASQGSGIGGDSLEACGNIEFAGGNLFLKGTATGALVGGDADNGAKNGNITISGGNLNLITNARGAAIGASNAGTCAGNVTIKGGTTTIVSCYRGSAIGYGAANSGNASVAGNFSMTGGSLKCVRTGNSLYEDGDTETQVVDDSLLTADKGNLALLIFDAKNDSVTVSNGYGTVTPEHRFRYAEVGASTIGSWSGASDSNVYLYLDKSKTYTLTRGDGQKFTAVWDEAQQAFVVEELQAAVLATTEIIDGIAVTTVDSAALVETLKNVSANTLLTITAEIPDGVSVYGAKTVLTRTDVQNMAKAGVLLKTESPIADITLTNAGLKDIAGRSGSEVVVSAITEKDGVHIGVSIDGEEIEKITGGLTVTLPIPDPTLDVVLVMVNPDGSETIMENAVIGRNSITVTVDGSCVLKVTEKPSTTLLTTTVIENGVAITTVNSQALKEVLKTVTPNTQLVITPDIPDGARVYGTKAVMTVEDTWSMALAGVSLKTESPIADITLSNVALIDVGNRKGSEVTISAITETEGISIEVAVDGVPLTKIESGIRVTLHLDKETTKNTVLVMVNADGTETVLTDAVIGKDYITVTLDGSCIIKVVEQQKVLEVLSTTVIENGKATTTINSEVLAEVLKEADASTLIVIAADIPEGVTVTEAETLLIRNDVRAIAASEASLKVSSPLADVTLSNAALKDVAGAETEDGNDEVTISAAVTERGTYIKVAVNGKVMSKVDSGLLVSLPVDKDALTPGTVMVLVDEHGQETVIKKSVAENASVTARLSGSCTVKAVDRTKSFDDVKDSHWYAGAVAFATGHDLFNGVSETKFDPTGLMTRSMLVTVLHRLEDTPAADVSGLFGDVPSGTWYTDAVDWASGNSIVTGTGTGFNPDGNVTREQIATILYRYMQYLELDTSARGVLSQYSDGDETSDWAYEAMQWAVGAGIITGKSDTVLDPGGNASRAEVATMLQRLIRLVVQ